MTTRAHEVITHAQAEALGITRCLCGCPVGKHARFPKNSSCLACKCRNLKRRVHVSPVEVLP